MSQFSQNLQLHTPTLSSFIFLKFAFKKSEHEKDGDPITIAELNKQQT